MGNISNVKTKTHLKCWSWTLQYCKKMWLLHKKDCFDVDDTWQFHIFRIAPWFAILQILFYWIQTLLPVDLELSLRWIILKSFWICLNWNLQKRRRAEVKYVLLKIGGSKIFPLFTIKLAKSRLKKKIHFRRGGLTFTDLFSSSSSFLPLPKVDIMGTWVNRGISTTMFNVWLVLSSVL